MKKFPLIIVALLVLFISCEEQSAQSKADEEALKKAAAAPKDTTTVQLIDSAYNFGSVTEGDKVEYNFRFKNIGTKPMVIEKTEASCGCTVAEKPEQAILPGDTSVIKVVFNSKGKLGHNEKHVRVIANTNPEFPSLLLTGEVLLKR